MEEANPACVMRTAAITEYCVPFQRSRADCGVTAGNNAELPSESDAAALSTDEGGVACIGSSGDGLSMSSDCFPLVRPIVACGYDSICLPGLAGPVLRSSRNLVLGSAGIGAVFPSPADWSPRVSSGSGPTGALPSNGGRVLVVPRRSTFRQRGAAALLPLPPMHGRAAGASRPRAATSPSTANLRPRR
ncbi:hypothetical protein NDU88_008634 [Pleurodeles waltl]|uniref:Uncharacterized protein n=1 Tax=Pleurodeles waltl TaxID=8319 RepID=A0AAV7QSB2_PLEWA|nr:hypothetical protein NDU88_008634 [Pleurodeles waltl]